MTKADKEPIVHKDKLDNLLEVGTHVAYPSHNSLSIGTIIRVGQKMVIVQELGMKASRYNPGETRKYPADCIKVDGPKLTMYILKKSS